MTIKAMGAKSRMGRASPLLLAALAVALASCSGNSNNSSAASATLPASTFSPTSTIQGSSSAIALDPVNQAIWVPSYKLDVSGNLQYELISTAAAVAGGTATISKKVSMLGCDTPIGIAYVANSASNGTLLVECGSSITNALVLSAVDAGSLAVTPIATPGLTWNGSYGGIIYDPQHNQAFVAGTQNFGLLQVPAGGTPSFDANSVTSLPFDPNAGTSDNIDNVVSMAMDFTTQQVVIATRTLQPYNYPQPYVVETSVVNASAPALNITQLPQITNPNTGVLSFGGAAFDSVTGVLALASDYQGNFYQVDYVGVFNMETYDAGPPSASSVSFNGFLDYYTGIYSGGLAALNAATHQVLIGDSWGPNLLLVQLPTTILGSNGNLNNNGQPSTTGVPGTVTPDASSAYALAQTVVSTQTAGTPAQFNAIGNPSALVIDSVNNIAYVLADDSAIRPHAWTASTGVTMTLVSLDLSAPVPDACPSLNNVFCPANWNPRTAQVVVP